MAANSLEAVIESIGANVTRLRKRVGLTQARLAESAMCETSYIQKVEYGSAMPTLRMLVDIANALDVPVGKLFRAAAPRKASHGRPRNRRKAIAHS